MGNSVDQDAGWQDVTSPPAPTPDSDAGWQDISAPPPPSAPAPSPAPISGSPSPPSRSIPGAMVDAYTSGVAGAWDKFKSDFVASQPNKAQFQSAGFWDRQKQAFDQMMAQGKLPLDAFNSALSLTGVPQVIGAANTAAAQQVAKVLPDIPAHGGRPGVKVVPSLSENLGTAEMLGMPERGAIPAAAVPGGPPPDLEMGVNPPGGPGPGPAGPIPRNEAPAGPTPSNAAPEPPVASGWQARRPGESARAWKARTTKGDVIEVDQNGVPSDVASESVKVNAGPPKALPAPPADTVFRTTPGAIAAEHEAEVSGLEAQGTADAAAKLKTTQGEGLSLPQKPWTEITPNDTGSIKDIMTRANNLRTQAFKAIPKKGDKADAVAAHQAVTNAFHALDDQVSERYNIDWNDIRKNTPAQIAQIVQDRNDPVTVGAAQDITDYNHYQAFNPPEKAHTMLDEIRDLGGVRDDGGDIGQILQGYKNPKFKKSVINPNGLSPDAIREALQERGWFGGEERFGPDAQEAGFYPGDALTDMHEKIEQEAHGSPVLHPEDAYKQNQWAAFEDETNRAGISAGDSFEESARKLAAFRKMHAANEPPADLQGTEEEIPGWDAERQKEATPIIDKGGADGVHEMIAANAGKPVGAVLDHIAETAGSGDFRILAKRLSALVGQDTKVRPMSFNEIQSIPSGIRVASYFPDDDTIAINAATPNATRSVLHEGVHAATFDAIERKTPAGKDIVNLYNDFKTLLSHSKVGEAEKAAYGFTNPHEFAAEALSNPKFQDTLKGVIGDAKQSLWDRFVQAVRKMLGWPTKEAVEDILTRAKAGFAKAMDVRETLSQAAEEGKPFKEAPPFGKRQPVNAQDIVGQDGGEGRIPGEPPDEVGGPEGKGYWEEGGPTIGQWLTQHEDELYRIMNNNKIDKLEALQHLWKIPDGHMLRDTKTEATFFHHGEEEGKFAHEQRDHTLTPEQQAVWARVIQPMRDLAHSEWQTIIPRLSPEQRRLLQGSDDLTGYMHRIVKGKGSEYDVMEGPAEKNDPITGRGGTGRGLGKKTSSMMARSPKFMAVGTDGSKVWVPGTDGQFTDARGSGHAAEDGAIYADKNAPGGIRVLRPATVEEIEKNTNLRYYKNALINTMDNMLKLRRVSRNLDYLNVLAADPVFAEHSMLKTEGHRPDGWVSPNIPQLEKYWMNPRMANMFNDYYNVGADKGDLATMFANLNSAMVRMIFANPVTAFMGHGANVAVHTVMQRGWMNFDPRSWPRSIVNFGKAANEVIGMGPIYKELMRQGMAGQFAAQYARDFHPTAMKIMQGEIEKDPKTWGDIARIAGTTPKHIYDWLSDTSSKALWSGSDILLMSHVLDQMTQRNLPVLAAIREAEKGIPNYRIPTEAWEGKGGRAFSEFMGNPQLTIFGRYRYGMLKAYAHTLKNTFAQESQNLLPPPPLRVEHQPPINVPMSENEIPSPPPPLPEGAGPVKTTESLWERRAQAAGMLLALYATYNYIYPELDKALQWVTKNKHASIRRAGAATIPAAVDSYINDKYKHAQTNNDLKDLGSVIGTVFSLPPLMQAAMSMALNVNPISGKHIYNPRGNGSEVGQEAGGFALTSPFLGQEAGEWATGSQSLPQIIGGFAGINNPTASQFALRRMYANKDAQSDTKAFLKRKAQRIRNFENKMQGLGGWFKNTMNPTGGGT